ncbi:MAG: hypothetical protein IT257_01095 [Chitinophagaceae bacterium]|nr:hypothetical protein [Chitinophagaceae bacterium]
MKSLSRFLCRIAHWKTLLLFALLYSVFPAYLLKNAEQKINALSGKSVGVIDLTLGFNPQRSLQMVADYSEEARKYYTFTELTTDMVYPPVYAFFFAIMLSLLYRNSPYRWVNVMPFGTMLADYLENIQIISLLKNYPQQSSNMAAMLEVIKLFKWLSFGSVILLVLTGGVLRLSGKWKRSAA